MSRSQPKTARIEVFRTGTFTPMQGEPISYTASDLKQIADVYDRETAPAPVVVGHPTTDAPAYGWAESFDFDAASGRLHATVGELDPAFCEAVKAGRYKKISLSFFPPDAPANPTPGGWYPKHIGFLGGAAPAVSGLRNASFADADQLVTFTADFGEPGFEQAASLFRGLREYIIEKFGLEEADKALPGYRIDWLDETSIAQPAGRPSFANPEQEPDVTEKNTADFAAREAAIADKERAIAERESKLAHDDNVAFAEQLVTEGRVIPASRDHLVAILDALPVDGAVSFADVKDVPLARALRDLLSAQPKVISFGQVEVGDAPHGADVAFAADGKAVDPEGLALHQRALAYQQKNPGTDYLAAVRAVG